MKWIIIISGFIVAIVIIVFTNIRNFRKRLFGIIDLSKSPESFKVSKIYNKNNNGEGIFSTCLFGNSNNEKFRKRYVEPLFKSKKVVEKAFPKWIYRIYLSPSIDKDILEFLIKNNFEVYLMNRDPKGYEGTMWRFYPAAENLPFLSVDSDEEEKTFDTTYINHVKSWLKSDQPFFRRRLSHITLFIPISAGCWGGKGRSIPNIKELIEKYSCSWLGSDEAFLTKEIWPLFKEKGYYTTSRTINELIILTLPIIILIIIIIILKLNFKAKFYN